MFPIPEWMKKIMPKKQYQQTNVFVPIPETTLPGGLVVPAFEVAKYICSKNDQGKLEVSYARKPWVRINYHDSVAACEAAGYQLIRESQYLALAYQIANQSENWTSGTVGKGKLYQGLRKSSVSEAQAGSYVPEDEDESRTFHLPGGHVIYDVAGNVFQWAFDDIQGDKQGLIAKPFTANSPSLVIPYPEEEKGQGWTPPVGRDWSGRALARGGCWGSAACAGVFRLNRGWPHRVERDNVGFRCTKSGL